MAGRAEYFSTGKTKLIRCGSLNFSKDDTNSLKLSLI
jgi:hypothetical protein